MQKAILVKIGGSVTTKKNSWEFPLEIEEIKKKATDFMNSANIQRIAREEIKSVSNFFCDNDDPTFPAFFFGAGIFGHHPVMNNVDGEIVHESVAFYAKLLEQYMNSAGKGELLKYTEEISPRKVLRYKDGKVDRDSVIKLKDLLKQFKKEDDRYQIITGDMIFDEDQKKLSPLSADNIIEELSHLYKVERIVMGTSVDGVYTKSPNYTDAKFIPEIKWDDDPNNIIKSYSKDATGGIMNKVLVLQRAAERGIPGYIVNANKEGELRNSIRGYEGVFTATVFVPKEETKNK